MNSEIFKNLEEISLGYTQEIFFRNIPKVATFSNTQTHVLPFSKIWFCNHIASNIYILIYNSHQRISIHYILSILSMLQNFTKINEDIFLGLYYDRIISLHLFSYHHSYLAKKTIHWLYCEKKSIIPMVLRWTKFVLFILHYCFCFIVTKYDMVKCTWYTYMWIYRGYGRINLC